MNARAIHNARIIQNARAIKNYAAIKVQQRFGVQEGDATIYHIASKPGPPIPELEL
jgi:hypothetical protein